MVKTTFERLTRHSILIIAIAILAPQLCLSAATQAGAGVQTVGSVQPLGQNAKPQHIRHTLEGMSILAHMVGIPIQQYNRILLPGYIERAEANTELARILYTSPQERKELFKQFPHWELILANHSGVWSELVGKLGDQKFARMYGPDTWLVRDPKTNKMKYVIGEENGPNVGGAEQLKLMSQYLKSLPEVGDVPYNEDFYYRMATHLKGLVKDKLRSSRKPVIVWADEGSLTKGPINVNGEMIAPPFFVGEKMVQNLKAELAKYGVEWLSLVDRADKQRIYVRNGVLYLKDARGNGEKKVDVLLSLADIESMDPAYEPQLRRNERAHRADLNTTAKLVGIEGLINAWSEHQSFVWVNNPTATLTANKLWPILVDEFIEWKTGRKPLLPLLETITFYDEKTGLFNEEKFNRVVQSIQDYVTKMTLGQGGKQVYFADEMTSAKIEETRNYLRSNAFSFAAQPKMELNQIALNFADEPERKPYYHDIRQIALISVEDITAMRQMMIRYSKNRKINVSQGGGMAAGIPANVTQIEALPPIPKAGSAYVPIPQELTDVQYQAILDDSRERALIEGYLLRDLYTDPEAFFRKFPLLRPILEGNAFYLKKFYESREENFRQNMPLAGPDNIMMSMFLSGPDYILLKGGGVAAIEHNTTNIGGLFRLWRRGEPGVAEEMKRWFREVLKYDPAKKEDKFFVYYLEETNLGDDWQKVRNDFESEFGVMLASKSEKDQFQVREDKLYYKNESGRTRQVTSMALHIESEFLDSTVFSDADLSRVASPRDIHEKRSHEIPGLLRAVRAGNLFVVNPPGIDVVCSKCLLPFMPALRKHYLGKDSEIIPTQASYSFLGPDGKFDTSVLKMVKANPDRFLLKQGQDIGGGDRVHVLSELNRKEKTELYKLAEKNPADMMVQVKGVLDVYSSGYHVEVRAINLVKFSAVGVEVVGTIPQLYARGANGENKANMLPTGEKAVTRPPGFNVPVRRSSQILQTVKSCGEILAPTRSQ